MEMQVTREIIHKIIKDNKSNFSLSIKKIFPIFYTEINLSNVECLKFSEKLYIWLNDKIGICKNCGQKTKFDSIQKGYREFCSNKCVNESDIIKKRIKTSFFIKYGFDNVSKNEKIKEKKRQTFIRKYGVKCPFNFKHVIEKRNITIQKKFELNGLEKIENLRFIKRKLFIESCVNGGRLGNLIPLFDYNTFTNIKDKTLKFKCKSCDEIFQHHLQWGTKPICRNCYPFSTYEGELRLFIKDNFDVSCIENSFNIIKPHQLDFYFPSKKLAIEFNGIYWHSEIFKSNRYHLEKTMKCEKLGIGLIHIFEDEWINKKDIIKETISDMIQNKTMFSSPNWIEEIDINGIVVDRAIYNKIYFDRVNSISLEETEPELIKRENCYVWNCGKFLIKKKYD